MRYGCEKQNEELQSRRDFFKKAARGALPILGAVLLSNMPNVVRAAEESPMGCTGTCYGACTNGCKGCEYTCSGGCKNSCKGTCNRSSR